MSQPGPTPADQPDRIEPQPVAEPTSAVIKPLLWILIPLVGLIVYAVFLM
jgi:hypothetical protein